MRIWHGISPKELDNRRLLAQHREFHIIYRKIAKGSHWQGWEKPEHRKSLWEYHESLIEEMHMRNYSEHCSFSLLEYETIQMPYPINSILQMECRWILICRWQGTYGGRGDAPKWAVIMQRRYHEIGGCQHDLTTSPYMRDEEVCMCCKRYARKPGEEWHEIHVGYRSSSLRV